MIKTGVLVVGPRVFWERICTVLAGAGYRPLYGGDGRSQSIPIQHPISLSIVGEDAHSPCSSASQLRATLNSPTLPVLLVPAETTVPEALEHHGFDDVANRAAENREIRSRVRRLLDIACLRQRHAEQAERLRTVEAELARAQRHIEGLSRAEGGDGRCDPMTGMLVASVFREELQHRCAAPGPLSLLLLNLDRFKALIDRHGHSVGDQMLAAVARRIRRALPDSATSGRIGEDSFAILVPLDPDETVRLAERIRRAVADLPFDLPGVTVSVTVSIGATTSWGEADAERLFRSAENALYEAKAAGRNRVLHTGDLERRILEADGSPEEHAFEAVAQVMTERVGQVLAYRGRRILDQVRQDAEMDALTGLYNRRYLDRRLPVEWARARESAAPLTVALIDIDFFGKVNKTFGWPTGDRVLADVASRIRQTVRQTDWVARYGGEELVVVMPGAPLPEAFAVAERVRSAIGVEPFLGSGGVRLSITASIGLAQADSESPFELVFETASRNLLEAKRLGRNRVRPQP